MNINDEDRNLIYIPPGVDSGREDQRNPDRPRHFRYHQQIAPQGMIFEANEIEQLDKNWVDTPAKFVSKENWDKKIAEMASEAEKERAREEEATKQGLAASDRIERRGGYDESDQIPKIPEKKVSIVVPKKPKNGPKKAKVD
jgi:hypothetical protein